MNRRNLPQGRRPTPRQPAPQRQEAFDQFNATALYCPRCGQAMPVRPQLFLVLPQGDKYTYHCAGCGEVLGEKVDRGAPPGLGLSR